MAPKRKAKARRNGPSTIKVTTINRESKTSAPVSSNTSRGVNRLDSLRYQGSERLLTVTATSGDFEVLKSFQVNPALLESFPWLAGMAKKFEKYKFHTLEFVYRNLVGTSTDGNVLLGFDYDVNDPPPATAVEVTQTAPWTDGAPWRTFSLKVPSDQRKLFTRTKELFGVDPKTYDMGQLHICTEGSGGGTLGYLEVKYDVSLFNKQPDTDETSPDAAAPAPTAKISWDQTNCTADGTWKSITTDALKEYDNIGVTTDDNRLFVPAGYYEVENVTEYENINSDVTEAAHVGARMTQAGNIINNVARGEYIGSKNANGGIENCISTFTDRFTTYLNGTGSILPQYMGLQPNQFQINKFVTFLKYLGATAAAVSKSQSSKMAPGEILDVSARLSDREYRLKESRDLAAATQATVETKTPE